MDRITDTTAFTPPKDGTIKNEITTKPLPKEIDNGSKIVCKNTLQSDPDSFSFFYMVNIAKKFNLDPEKDYDRIVELSQNPELAASIRNELNQEAITSYTVTNKIIPNIQTGEQTKIAYNGSFFDRFSHLENSGRVEVSPEELSDVQHVYIGGSLNTPASKNLFDKQTYGDLDENPTYYTTDYEVAMSHLPDEEPILIEVSVARLLTCREVLRDPESLYIETESGKTFISFHGIPAAAIERILILEKN